MAFLNNPFLTMYNGQQDKLLSPLLGSLYRWSCIITFIFLFWPVGGANVEAQSRILEYQVKAAFLYKFAAYVEWPPYTFASEDSPIVYGVIGADDLANTLAEIVNTRRVHDRNIEVRKLESLEGVSGVHVLFVGRSETPDLDNRLYDAAITSVLTVTETSNPRSFGSIINFEILDDRIQFDISLDMAKQANLRISSRLLQVAHRVINEAL